MNHYVKAMNFADKKEQFNSNKMVTMPLSEYNNDIEKAKSDAKAAAAGPLLGDLMQSQSVIDSLNTKLYYYKEFLDFAIQDVVIKHKIIKNVLPQCQKYVQEFINSKLEIKS